MRELSFVGLSADGRRLLLVSADATEFALRIDDRLANALRREGERLRGQPTDLGPMPRNPSPREIQERIRGGMSVSAIAAAAGVAESAVARFASPVLAERAFVADQACQSMIRFEDVTMPLGDAVAARLGGTGINIDTVRWDAWRRGDGDWTVICAYPFDLGERIATFGFDPTGRRVWPDDDEARWIIERPADAPDDSLSPPEPGPPPAAPPATGEPRSWDPNHPAARAHQRRAQGPAQAGPGGAMPGDVRTSGDPWEQLLLGDREPPPNPGGP